MTELQITVKDLKGKTDKMKIIEGKLTLLPIQINKQRQGRMILDDECQLASVIKLTQFAQIISFN